MPMQLSVETHSTTPATKTQLHARHAAGHRTLISQSQSVGYISEAVARYSLERAWETEEASKVGAGRALLHLAEAMMQGALSKYDRFNALQPRIATLALPQSARSASRTRDVSRSPAVLAIGPQRTYRLVTPCGVSERQNAVPPASGSYTSHVVDGRLSSCKPFQLDLVNQGCNEPDLVRLVALVDTLIGANFIQCGVNAGGH